MIHSIIILKIGLGQTECHPLLPDDHGKSKFRG